MKLFVVQGVGWGTQIEVVRAEDEEEAKRVANLVSCSRVYVTELEPDGPATPLWSWDHSPDSRP